MINLGCLLARLKISRILINVGNIDQTVLSEFSQYGCVIKYNMHVFFYSEILVVP